MKPFSLMILLNLLSGSLWAEGFSASVQNVDIDLTGSRYVLSADIAYSLSPMAKEALQKGIPLTWELVVKVKQVGFLWDMTLKKISLKYQLKNHALLNLYSVKNLNTESTEMFSSLTGALNTMSRIRHLELIDKMAVQSLSDCYIAIKVAFSREALPTPLRPLSYFDSQWALSSDWTLWPLQN